MPLIKDSSGRLQRRAPVCLLVALLLFAAVACTDDDDSASSDGDGGDTTTSDTSGDSTADLLGPVDEASGEPVRIGFITDGENAVTDQSIELDVADATVQYLNMHKGGIDGRPIELVTCEAKVDPAVATDCANQMVEEGVPAVVVGTVATVEPVWTPLHDAGVPVMFFAGAAEPVLADADSTFTLTDPNAPTAQLPIAVAKENGEDKVTAVIIDVPAALTVYEGSGAQLFDEAGIELDIVRVAPGTADMVPQLQDVVAGDPGEIHVLGNDSFCIAAFQALDALAFDGPVSAVTPCISDATREALPPESLEGIVVGASSPVDANDDTDALYRAVMETYGQDIDTTRSAGHSTFSALAGFAAALEGLSGEITPETVTATIKAMPEMELPDGGGLVFKCDGEQVPDAPAVCVSGGLVTVLDAEGNATTYQTT